MAYYTNQPQDFGFTFSKVGANQPDEDYEEQEKQNKKRSKFKDNQKKKKIMERATGLVRDCLLCNQPIVKRGEQSSNESFRMQLITTNDEDVGVEQYFCGSCDRCFTVVVTKQRIKVSPTFQMQPE